MIRVVIVCYKEGLSMIVDHDTKHPPNDTIK